MEDGKCPLDNSLAFAIINLALFNICQNKKITKDSLSYQSHCKIEVRDIRVCNTI
jgi:hypothetical protein